MQEDILFFPSSQKRPQRPIPSRKEVLSINMHFRGGLIIDSVQFGKMPWYPPALSWCDKDTRRQVYVAMRDAGDTHAIIEIPNGFPLYDEPNQFYSPDKFGPLDWTNGETKLDQTFSDLVDEVIDEGFYFIIAMDERPQHSKRIVNLVMQTLTDYQLSFGLTIPGYDGVFYGWPQVDIIEWSSTAREIKPNCYLGMEFNVGHIPLGNDNKDYQIGGSMDGFDCLLSEFDSSPGLHSDTTWQILGRLIKPYHRAIDQPIDDDPHPPFYLVDSPRGERFFCFFETDYPYRWVRVNMNDIGAINSALAEIETEKEYAQSMGCLCIG